MVLRIAIVDDSEADRNALKAGIERFFSLQRSSQIEIRSYTSGAELLKEFSPDSFSMAFLDICMDEMTGIELAQELRSIDQRLLIVFQTSSREYAFDAFPVHPFDYLIKPLDDNELDGVLAEATKVIKMGDPEIKVTSSGREFNVPLRKIIAAESNGHYVDIHLTNKQKITSSDTFKDISDALQKDERFLTINRGIMVNMDHVLSPKEGVMGMKDGSSYFIKVNGRAEVLSHFSQYMISRLDKR